MSHNESGDGISMLNNGKVYTIQIRAARRPIGMEMFKEIEGVKELFGKDGYRYIVGEFNFYSQAKASLGPIKESGYDDAFITELN